MKHFKKFLSTAVAVMAVFAFGSCSSDDNNANNEGNARVKVRMTDAPGDYEQVNIEVIDVKMKANGESGEGGWVSIGNVVPQVYNLLDLTGGVSVLLSDSEIAAGYLGQLRLILGDNNTIVKDGVTHNLTTPSAQQSGLKLQVNKQLLPYLVYDFLIDFDVDASIVEAGNSGNYILKPVLRVSTEANSGSIRGFVAPGPYQIVASVMVDGVMISSYANALGEFVLQGVPEGSYVLTVTVNSDLGYTPVQISNVVVVNGQVTNVGSISL